MSGGYYNYDQYKIEYIANEIEQLILNNDSEETDEWGDPKGAHYLPDTIAEFERAVKLLRQAFVYAHRIDWLISGDDGEDTFHQRLAHELSKLGK